MENKNETVELKVYVDYLIDNNVSKEEAIKLIRECETLSKEEKNLIYAYVFPRPLGDKELPIRVQEFRRQNNIPPAGTLTPSTAEATLIVEAERTLQYGRFIKHLIHSFINDPSSIFPIDGEETSDCAICGKILYEKVTWDRLIEENPGTEEDKKMEFLSLGSSNSSVTLCSDCLAQLYHASTLLKSIDPDYLDWRKSREEGEKKTWNDLNL